MVYLSDASPRAYMKDADGFLGGSRTVLLQSQKTKEFLDSEINSILDSCHEQAKTILKQQEGFLRNLTDNLLKTETLDSKELDSSFEYTLKKRGDATLIPLHVLYQKRYHPTPRNKNVTCTISLETHL